MKWKTQDDRELIIGEMTTKHIKNCLAMLNRKGFIPESLVEGYLDADPDIMGEHAADVFMRGFMAMCERPVSKHIDAFKEELELRHKNKQKRWKLGGARIGQLSSKLLFAYTTQMSKNMIFFDENHITQCLKSSKVDLLMHLIL